MQNSGCDEIMMKVKGGVTGRGAVICGKRGRKRGKGVRKQRPNTYTQDTKMSRIQRKRNGAVLRRMQTGKLMQK